MLLVSRFIFYVRAIHSPCLASRLGRSGLLFDIKLQLQFCFKFKVKIMKLKHGKLFFALKGPGTRISESIQKLLPLD